MHNEIVEANPPIGERVMAYVAYRDVKLAETDRETARQHYQQHVNEMSADEQAKYRSLIAQQAILERMER